MRIGGFLMCCAVPAATAAWSAGGGSLAPEAAVELEAGVSLELARSRAASLDGVAYEVSLDVREGDRATGVVAVTVERRAGAGDLVLDFQGLDLGEVRANGSPVPDAAWRAGHVVVPAARLREGVNRLELPFTAAIAPAGASVIRFDDPTDGARYLYTLLVPSDAHRLFPCFDQPDLKARIRWRITVPEGWTVVANGALERTTALPGGTRWEFGPTEPISTYLAAFAAGPWRVVEGPPAAGGVPMRLFVRASRAREADADTLLRINREALERLEAYFAVPYPFGKLDLVLAPAFPFGGMEHVGAIFYNEERFIFREPPTLTQRLARSATIYHEVAHQWFGDLVTMRWFDDLWLKEGFSTFMAARLQEELEPESGAWKTFHLRTKPPAYTVDATSGTTPVWQELPSLELAKSNYGPIVYNKAPAVLKQLEYLVGEEAFRAGIRLFLERHAFGNADWRELLAAVGEAAGAELGPFGAHYILRAGMPLVETELEVVDGRIRELALVQRPARPLPGDPGGAWPGRVRVLLVYPGGDEVAIPVRFAGERTVVAEAAGRAAPAAVLANDGDFGYGIFLPDAASAAWLLENAGGFRDGLRRAVAWSTLWELVRFGRLEPEAYVARVLEAMPAERDEQIAAAILGRALYALERYVPPGEGATRLAAETEALLLARADDPGLPYGPRKAALDAFLGAARTPAGVAALRDFLAGRRRFDGEPLAQPSRWAAVRRLTALGAAGADSLRAAEAARDTTPGAERMAFIAGAAVPTAANKATYFERYLGDPELNEEWVTASLDAFNDPLHAELTLPFLRPALARSEWIRENRRIFFLPSWINSFVGGHASPSALGEVDGFLEESRALPVDIRRRILQARDELERAVRIRSGEGKAAR